MDGRVGTEAKKYSSPDQVEGEGVCPRTSETKKLNPDQWGPRSSVAPAPTLMDDAVDLWNGYLARQYFTKVLFIFVKFIRYSNNEEYINKLDIPGHWIPTSLFWAPVCLMVCRCTRSLSITHQLKEPFVFFFFRKVGVQAANENTHSKLQLLQGTQNRTLLFFGWHIGNFSDLFEGYGRISVSRLFHCWDLALAVKF